MKNFTLLTLLLLVSTIIIAQENSYKTDSYTIQRLILKNNKGEILIYKGKHNWMTPALRHSKDESIKEALENLANSYGLEIDQPKLAGLFTYKFDFKIGVSFRSFYTANVKGDDTAAPPAPITQAKWVAPSEVMDVVGGIKARKSMLKQILDNPETLWGGSFFLYDDKDGNRKSKTLEKLYPLR